MGLSPSIQDGLVGVRGHLWHHRNGTDCLGVVGLRDNPPVQPGNRDPAPSSQGGGRLTPTSRVGLVVVAAGQRQGGRAWVLLHRGRAHSTRDDAASTEHLVQRLPQNRSFPSSTSKETALEKGSVMARLVQGGVPITGSLLLGARYTSQSVTMGQAISTRQDPRSLGCKTLKCQRRRCAPTNRNPPAFCYQTRTLPSPKPAAEAAPVLKGSGCDQSSPAFPVLDLQCSACSRHLPCWRASVGMCVNKTKTSVSANTDKSDNET